MSETELIVKALRNFAEARLIDLMNEGMTSTEGNDIRRGAAELADHIETLTASQIDE